MANRRQFIQSGLALSALSYPRLSAWAATQESRRAPVLRLERFVFDSRFVEAAESAHHAGHHGVRLAELSGDLMDLWYRDLDLSWKSAPMALAGVTAQAELFVLETFAADHRMRVVYRGEHAAPRAGRVVHRLTGPASVTGAAAGASGPDFWAELGEAMTCCLLGRRFPVSVDLSTSQGKRTLRTQPLISWIIAPLSAVGPAV
jgi:hypothetical protein